MSRDPRSLFIRLPTWFLWLTEIALLVLVCFIYAGDEPPMVNEAHYLVQAKNFWQPAWCARDVFVSSSKAHWLFYVVFGWPTQYVSLSTTAWMGRFVGWTMIAIGLSRLCHCALRMRFASIAVAVVWIAGVEYANLAGEWVIGGIESKVPAYGLMLLGISYLVQRNWSGVWLWLGAASAFHVLVGGWSVVAAAFAWWIVERPRRDVKPFFTWSLLLGGAISLVGLVPSLALTLGTPDDASTAAARIYTYFRLSHHLAPASFYPSWYLRHGLLLISLLLAAYAGRTMKSSRLKPLTVFASGAIVIMSIGLLLGALPAIAPDLAAKVLRFYWFRLSDSVVPLCFGVIIVRLLTARKTPMPIRLVAGGIVILASAVIAYSSYERGQIAIPPSVDQRLLGLDPDASPEKQQHVFEDWVAVCEWVRTSTPRDEILLTPRHQQSFKWYAHRGEVVNWKDVPQDVSSLLQWRRRFSEVFPRRLGRVRTTFRHDGLQELQAKYGVQLMVVDRRIVGQNLPLVRVYPQADEENVTYAVYQLPIESKN